MRKKIQKSMVLVISVTLLLVYGIAIFIIYHEVSGLNEKRMRQEVDFIAEAVNVSGEQYLKELDNVDADTRVTLISPDGEVEYDSVKDSYTFENHRNRPEVREALKTGSGNDVRRSDTLKKDMLYYARRLNDGNVLRVSASVRNVYFISLELLPAMIVIAAGMMAAALFVSRRQAKRIVQPINRINLDRPLENNGIYEELRPLLIRIDQQNKEKDAVANMRQEFSANVSHELKTPLTSISGYAEIMRDGLVRPDDIPEFSNRIYKEANRLITLIGDIIKISELDEGVIELEQEPVDLYGLAGEVARNLEPEAAGKNVSIYVHGEKTEVTGIRQVLQEMIFNLADNAVKYNKADGRVDISAGTENGRKFIRVKDTGIGIPEDQTDRVFERFYRVDKSHSRETGGTGLGLSIVKHGALIHHADLKVTSRLGSGTTMQLTFPLEGSDVTGNLQKTRQKIYKHG